MRPLTERIPKALLDIAGEPFLLHQLRLLKRHGIRKIVLAVGFLGEMIQQRFGDGSELGLSIAYSFDGPKLLGTAGAIRQALPSLPENFFVLYGDSYLECDYHGIQLAFERSGLPALMTVYRNEGLFDTSNVEFDGTRILCYDKQDLTSAMQHIDYGLGVFNQSVFAMLPAVEVCDLAALYQDLLRSGRLAAFEVKERFYEIGSRTGLQETTMFLESRKSKPAVTGD